MSLYERVGSDGYSHSLVERCYGSVEGHPVLGASESPFARSEERGTGA